MRWLTRLVIVAIVAGVAFAAYRVNTTRPTLLAAPTETEGPIGPPVVDTPDRNGRMTAEQALRSFGAPESGHEFAGEDATADGPRHFTPKGPPSRDVRRQVRDEVGRALERSYERASAADSDR